MFLWVFSRYTKSCVSTLKSSFSLLCGLFNLPITFCSYKKLAIFTTNVHTKHECLCHHKTVMRSTKPPIFCRCCYHQCLLVCRSLYVLFCLLSFVFLSCGGAFFKISFCLGLALQALLKALV